jgi:LVIVD repeat-containing protein
MHLYVFLKIKNRGYNMSKYRIFFVIILFALLISCAKPNEPAPNAKIMQLEYFFKTVGEARDIYVTGDLVYVAEDQGEYSIYNYVTNELVLQHNGDMDNARLISVEEESNTLFVYDRYGSPAQILAYDVTDPSNPIPMDNIVGGTGGIEEIKTYPGADGIIDIFFTRNETNHEIFYGTYDGNYLTPIYNYTAFEHNLYGFDRDDDYFYLAYQQLGLLIISQETGEIVSFTDTDGDARNVKIVDNFAYITDRYEGFAIIDISDVNNPVKLSQVDTSGYTRNIDVEGNYMVVSAGGSGVYLYDITDKSNPEFIDRIDDSEIGYTYKAMIKNNIIIVATRMGIAKISINL